MMVKGSIQEEGRTSENIYAPKIGAPHYMRQTLPDKKKKKVIDSNTSMDISYRKKINKGTQALNAH